MTKMYVLVSLKHKILTKRQTDRHTERQTDRHILPVFIMMKVKVIQYCVSLILQPLISVNSLNDLTCKLSSYMLILNVEFSNTLSS